MKRSQLFRKLVAYAPKRLVYTLYLHSRFGQWMNWRKPKGFNQKIQWLKLKYRDPLLPICADKYRVRKFVADRVGEEILNECYGVYTRGDEIDFDALPSRFVAKANHGSGQIIVCTDKTTLDRKVAVEKMNGWMAMDFASRSGEWHYRDIPRRIVVEKFIEEIDSLKDYRFYCYDGIPRFVRVIFDRVKPAVKESLYTPDWSLFYGSLHFPVNENRIPPPPRYSELLKIAASLSKGFPFVRVDLYNPDERILFGEMTFHPGNGVNPFVPAELDEVFGKHLTVRVYKSSSN